MSIKKRLKRIKETNDEWEESGRERSVTNDEWEESGRERSVANQVEQTADEVLFTLDTTGSKSVKRKISSQLVGVKDFSHGRDRRRLEDRKGAKYQEDIEPKGLGLGLGLEWRQGQRKVICNSQ